MKTEKIVKSIERFWALFLFCIISHLVKFDLIIVQNHERFLKKIYKFCEDQKGIQENYFRSISLRSIKKNLIFEESFI